MMAMTAAAEARQATCTIRHPHDRGKKLFSFDIDDTKQPYIFNVNGIDGGASGEPVIDIRPFDSATAEFETWYYGNVKMEANGQRTRFQIAFGEPNWATKQFRAHDQYALYVDWEYGTAGWLNEGIMYNFDDILEKVPNVVVYPASCRRKD
jgi:hypothetical protein